MNIITQISKNIQHIFTTIVQEASEKTNLIQRKRSVTGANLCQTLVFGWLRNPDITLEGLAVVAMEFGLNISTNGLDKRFDETLASFLQEVLSKTVALQFKNSRINMPSMNHFSHVYAEDSSLVILPNELIHLWEGTGGTHPNSAIKLQVRMDIKDGTLDGPYLASGRTSDKKIACKHEGFEENALYLRDLGYWQLQDFEEASQTKSILLSRLKASSCIWYKEKIYTLNEFCLTIKDDSFDLPILLGRTAKVPVRLIGKRASPEAASELRRKKKQDAQRRGRTLSKASLNLCDWTLIVTNATVEQIPTRDAFIWLGLRWQIELLFKLWKSIAGIDKSRSKKPWRQLCELYAKLIAVVLQHWLFLPTLWNHPNRSLTKAAKVIQSHVIRICMAIGSVRKMSKVIRSICVIFDKHCRINKSCTTPRTFQKLASLEGAL